MAPQSMRGLATFIADIRACSNKEEEEKRIQKELANIRTAFKDADKLDSYAKKKYTAKLVYIYLLGYDIDFGHMEAINMISSNKFSDKQMGYFAVTVLINEENELVRLLVNSIQQDLTGKSETGGVQMVTTSKGVPDPQRSAVIAELNQCLALTAIANIGGKEIAEALTSHVQKLLVSTTSPDSVRKKAALCLVKLFRKFPDLLPSDQWATRITSLLESTHFGLLTSVMGLLLVMVQKNPQGYEITVPKVAQKLAQIVLKRAVEPDYVYHDVPSPWLQVKYLRLLQFFPPVQDPTALRQIEETLQRLISVSDFTKDGNHNNARYAVLFEAINTIIHLDMQKGSELSVSVATLLGRFVTAKEANIRYLGLLAMARFAKLNDAGEHIRKHQQTIIEQLSEPDISIRRAALDLLYSMCDKSNAKEIVTELVLYLEHADWVIREELVLKIAILAEKYPPTLTWYVDIIMQLMSIAGEAVADDIWFRVVHIVTKNESLQAYASNAVWRNLNLTGSHENMVKIGGYILGEFGKSISKVEESNALSQFHLLNAKFESVGPATRALLLSTFIKFHNQYPEIRREVEAVFKTQSMNIDSEIQQRACEYLALSSQSIISKILEEMPPFPDRASAVVQLLKQKQAAKAGAEGAPELNKEKSEESSSNDVPVGNVSNINSSNTNTNTNTSANSGNLLDLLGDTPTPVASKPVQQQQQQVPKPSTAMDLLSDLGFSSTPQQQPQVQQQQQQQQQQVQPPSKVMNDLDDLLSMGTSTKPTTSSTSSTILPTSTAGLPAAVPANVLAAMTGMGGVNAQMSPNPIAEPNFTRMSVVNDGIVYEDANIQVGAKTEYHGAVGRIVLFYGNKNAQAAFMAFSATLQNKPEIKIQQSGIANTIGPHQQLQQMYGIECLNEFVDPPLLALSFNVNAVPVNICFKLPLVVTKFIVPAPIQAGEFLNKWKSIPEGPPLEYSMAIPNMKNLTPQQLAGMATQGLHLQLLQNVDPSPQNLVFSGTFKTTTKSLPVLAILESLRGEIKVTVRSESAGLTRAVSSVIVRQIQ